MGVWGVQERPLIPAEGRYPVRHLWNIEVLHHTWGISVGRTAEIQRGGEGGTGEVGSGDHVIDLRVLPVVSRYQSFYPFGILRF